METAKTQFLAENFVQTVDPDSLYKFDSAAHRALLAAKPWARDPHYFKHVKISALALLKLIMHTRSGGDLEVMGLLQGAIDGDTFVVLDSFALPVEGTETRVNAQEAAYEYSAQYVSAAQAVGRSENVVGWYHSHPGYGCWLSGIDVETQNLQQMHQDPFVAIVVDPKRTMSSGKVDLGAFRTLPGTEAKVGASAGQTQSSGSSIPVEKVEEFGVHANRYYPLQVSYFKNSLESQMFDALWASYWGLTLASSPLLNSEQFATRRLLDVSVKMERYAHAFTAQLQAAGLFHTHGAGKRRKASVPASMVPPKRGSGSGPSAPSLSSTTAGSSSAGSTSSYAGPSSIDVVAADSANVVVEELTAAAHECCKMIAFHSDAASM